MKAVISEKKRWLPRRWRRGFESPGEMRLNSFGRKMKGFCDLFIGELMIAAVHKNEAALLGKPGHQAIYIFFQEFGLDDLFIERRLLHFQQDVVVTDLSGGFPLRVI